MWVLCVQAIANATYILIHIVYSSTEHNFAANGMANIIYNYKNLFLFFWHGWDSNPLLNTPICNNNKVIKHRWQRRRLQMEGGLQSPVRLGAVVCLTWFPRHSSTWFRSPLNPDTQLGSSKVDNQHYHQHHRSSINSWLCSDVPRSGERLASS